MYSMDLQEDVAVNKGKRNDKKLLGHYQTRVGWRGA